MTQPNPFPRLNKDNHQVTSAATEDYNCIAWAAYDDSHWWEPDAAGDYYWPPTAPREYTMRAFISAYGSLGYRKCDNGDVESGFEKIAIFANRSGTPTHAARQLADGKWTSKCGMSVDMEHDLDALTGGSYGEVAMFLKRRI